MFNSQSISKWFLTFSWGTNQTFFLSLHKKESELMPGLIRELLILFFFPRPSDQETFLFAHTVPIESPCYTNGSYPQINLAASYKNRGVQYLQGLIEIRSVEVDILCISIFSICQGHCSFFMQIKHKQAERRGKWARERAKRQVSRGGERKRVPDGPTLLIWQNSYYHAFFHPTILYSLVYFLSPSSLFGNH